ncbi:MAG: hypothetical protein JRJ27_14200 [Deltaproteobacteria bacterium]|nr:hypothetical protein [Deltaproteobacteria bacterium]
MYLARKKYYTQLRYYIRDTYQDGACLKSRDVFDLGIDPSRYIKYPGGNAYYFDEIVEETLAKLGLRPTQDELDSIFWEFLDPEIQRVIKGFQRTSKKPADDSPETNRTLHLFDKRRIHYLRFAQADQRHLSKLPAKLFKALHGKSRDEIEQYFIAQERILQRHELKTYVYTIFDLKRFFNQAYAQNPQHLNSAQMDDYFIDAVCQLNDDAIFWTGMETSDRLQDYLIKYVVMYFDYDFPGHSPFLDYLNDFRNRHRAHTPPKKILVKMEDAARLFETSWEKLKQMDLSAFNQLYRKLALKHHPDHGGDQAIFIQLTEIYEGLLKKKKE